MLIIRIAGGYYDKRIPYILLACKSDLPLRIPPADALVVAKKHDGGIIEISSNEFGRDKARRCVGVLLRGVMRRRCKSSSQMYLSHNSHSSFLI